MPTTPAIPALLAGASYAAVVQHYVLHRREQLHEELRHFSKQPSFDLALNQAVLAVDRRGKRLSHQRRLPTQVIPKSLPLITAARSSLAKSQTFDELFDQVETILNAVPKAGDLYRYDTSLRMGAYLGLYPTRVFLQTGAYDGAREVSRGFTERSVPLSRFPEPFHSLAPFEVENLLCIYKGKLAAG